MLGAVVVTLGACSEDPTEPTDNAPELLQLSAGQVKSLDSTGKAITDANPTNGTLKSLVDSTLLVLSVGVTAKRLDVSTNLTTKPLYFVGVHRAYTRAGSSFSTWTLVGMDDPSSLASIVEVSGFAQNATNSAPTSVAGTIGDGTGIVNGLMLDIGTGGAVTQWTATAGSASFTSDAPGGACPNFTGPANVTCTLETMRVHFTANAGARQASITTDVDVPAMRLSYSF
jgi:hypothetical protein